MSASSPQAWFMSVSLHAAIVIAMLLTAYVAQQKPEPTKVFELVAGEGDNYMAKEAPALGSEGGGVKVDVPKMPEPKPVAKDPAPAPPVEEPTPAPPPPTPAPPKKEVIKPDPKTPVPAPLPDPAKDMGRAVRMQVIRAESKAKLEIKKQRAAEAKKAAEEKKIADAKKAAEEKRLTKEEFDKANANKKVASAKTPNPKVTKIDAEGIAKGVVGGSTANKQGGAGGKALVASEGKATELYFEMLKQKVRAELQGLAGMDDKLGVTVVFHISATGVLSRARVKTSSGNAEFDKAVIAAFDRVRMPDHPEKKSEELELIFRTKDIETR